MSGSFAGSKALQRVEKLRDGKSPEEIAAEEGVSVETVQQSIREHKARQLLDARMGLERQNNRLRRRIQQNLATNYENALKKLLEGKKEIAILVDGEVIPVTVCDPKALSLGLEQYRRSVAMEEKPGAPTTPTTIINVNQQNSNAANSEDMERRLQRIRRMRAEREAVDVEAEIVIEPESSEDRLERIRRLRQEGLAQKAQKAGTTESNDPSPGEQPKAEKWDF